MKLWGGRFSGSTSPETDSFNSSISFDSRLYREDIRGSAEHARMLAKQGIIPKEDAAKILSELEKILAGIEDGSIGFSEDAEDIHMNIEKILTERIGSAGKKLHTARSRNDQVALDMRMYIKSELAEISVMIRDFCDVLMNLASQHTETIMPGYTHLQKAQPITLGHHLMAYVFMLIRDLQRLAETFKRADVSPLGSGALAGTTYPIDRGFVAAGLGFAGITYNSLDAVSDRDFCLDTGYAISMIMMHLSRFAEEAILWASGEFGFIELDDAYSTGSSIMPQKKNPDIAELVRGKTGRVYGNLLSLLTVMKGLPLAYNKDMQEDKEAIFDSIDTVKACVPLFSKMLETARFNKKSMLSAAKKGYTNATDLADYLVRKGLAFRDAHEITGKIVSYCVSKSKAIDELFAEELKSFSEHISGDVYEHIKVENCVYRRDVEGGPAPKRVKESIDKAAEMIKKIALP